MTVQKTAVLVIRAWLEEGLDANSLRARITRTVDVSNAGTFEVVAASEEEILAVRAWLRSLTTPPGDGPVTPPSYVR
ncbi:MAG: hypothetical protein MSC30_05445 [Gaiellaceae bacterium MAG52_C11]|nr:hypothetical protein [Candidatus Gaiellasilicea maunaloa]